MTAKEDVDAFDAAPLLKLTREQWFKLPLKLRQRYWRETDYGRNPEQMSTELKEASAVAQVGFGVAQ